ncbi:MAG: TetR family transcriptional regulator [Pseudonocardiales bacterium]|nr:TetR family transcriptional regulator [Pseudonocardiales bacterium]
MTADRPRCVGELVSDLVSSRMSELIPRRRRGAELEDAICRAAFEELTEEGYGGFTIESVANRAGTGKASIYRRWPGKDELLLDAFCRGIPEPEDCFVAGDLDPSVSTRDALLQVVRTMVGATAGKKKAAMHAMAGETARDPEFARVVDRLILTPRREGLADLLRRGIGVGDVSVDAPIELVAELVPAFFMSRFLFRHVETTDADIVAFVDGVAMPLLQPGGRPDPQKSEPAREQQLRYV